MLFPREITLGKQKKGGKGEKRERQIEKRREKEEERLIRFKDTPCTHLLVR